MAATDARPVPIKNTAFRYYFCIRKNDGTLITSWTGADSEVSLDGASFADCTNEATEIGTSGVGYLDLTSSEMNADAVTLKITVTNTSALPLVVTFFPQEGADIKVDATHFGGSAGTFASGIPAASLTAGAVQAIWDAATSALTTAGSIGKAILDNWTTLLARLTSTRAGYLDNLSGGAVALNADMSTLLTRMSSARAGYLDNLNVGGAVASQADINALNQSASRRIILTSVQQFERPESGDSDATFTIEARTYDGDGAAVNADSTPTLNATGTVTGPLAANLSSATNPATGVYRWTYTVASSHAIEQIRFDLSATMSSTFTLSHYAQVVNFVATTFTAADRTKLEALNSDWADGGRLDLILDSRASQTSVDDVPTNAELATALGTADDATLAAIAALSIPTTTQISDAVLSRNVSNVESSAGEHTLCTMVLAALESSVSGTAWTIKRTNGSTTHATKAVTVDASADPITGVS